MTDLHLVGSRRPTYLYRAWCSHGGLLYVGITDNVQHRLRQHRHASDWWSEMERITVLAYPTRRAALTAERCLIEQEQPPYNVAMTREGMPSDREMREVVVPAIPGVDVAVKVDDFMEWEPSRQAATSGWDD